MIILGQKGFFSSLYFKRRPCTWMVEKRFLHLARDHRENLRWWWSIGGFRRQVASFNNDAKKDCARIKLADTHREGPSS